MRPFLARFSGALALLVTLQASAQTGEETVESLRQAREKLIEEQDRMLVVFRANQSILFRSDLDESGSISIARSLLGATLGWRTSDQLQFGVDIAGEYSHYSFRDASGLGAGISDPLSDALQVTITPSARWAIDDHWVATVAGLLRFAGELGADVGDSITGGGFVTIGYQFTEDLLVSLGVGVLSRLEDDADVIPLIGVEWRVDETFSVFTEGTGVGLFARLDEAWSVKLFGRWDSRDFRLDDDGENPEGVLRDEAVSIGVDLIWRPGRAVDVSVGTGAVVYHNYELLDESGDELGDDDGDVAPFIHARVRLHF